ncbi:MAG: hypothetical protein ACI8SA_002321 [Dokdonia sp.]|jgi:hypothetical protein
MKKLFNVFLFIYCATLFSQEYEPLLNDYNEWHTTYCFFGCYTDVYYTNGDTIVDGMDYKVLDGFHFISRTFLLREELLERKVYLNFVQETGNTEYLLYDFSLNVGDTFDMKNPISPFPEDAGDYDLDSIILRPLVDGNDYRHFYFSPSESNTTSTTNAIWVEGAGSLSLINAPSGEPDINDVGHLSCFFKNGESFYANLDSIEACEPTIVLDMNEYYYPLDEIIVSTNHNTNHCKLDNIEGIKFIDLYDINGRRLESFTNNGNKNLTFDVSNYTPGIYIIIVHTKQFKKKTFKIIIQ